MPTSSRCVVVTKRCLELKFFYMFIFFFDSKEKTNQKKKLPPGISAIPNLRRLITVENCENKGGFFSFRLSITIL